MIHGFVSILLPAISSRPVRANDNDDDDDDGYSDRLSSSMCSIATDAGSQSTATTSQAMEHDLMCSTETLLPPPELPCRKAMKPPEVAHTVRKPVWSPPGRRRASTIPSPWQNQHQKLCRSSNCLRPPPLPPIKPLSPIYEPLDLGHDESDAYIATSPTRVQPSPTSYRGRAVTGGTQAFIKRPLNRSLTNTSLSSLRSAASGAPKLPPLNLRPHFKPDGPLLNPPQSSPPPSAQSSQMYPSAQSSQMYLTPQSVTSSTSQKFGFFDPPQKRSARCEDEGSDGTGSFVTARSEGMEHMALISSKCDTLSTTDPIIQASEEGKTRTHFEVQSPSTKACRNSFDICSTLEKGGESSKSVYSMASTTTKNNTDDGDQSTKAEVDKDSFVVRWNKGRVSARNCPADCIRAKESGMTDHARQAYVLFWIGFVAPWCWLIGGWMLHKTGPADAGRRTIPDKAKSTGVAEQLRREEKTGCGGSDKTICPDLLSSTMSSTALIGSSSDTMEPKTQEDKAGVNTWASRYRTAALVAGVFIALTLFTVAIST